MAKKKEVYQPITLMNMLPAAGVECTIRTYFARKGGDPSKGVVSLLLHGEPCLLQKSVIGYSNTDKYVLRNLQKWAQEIAVDFALAHTYKQRLKEYGFAIRNKDLRKDYITSPYQQGVKLVNVQTAEIAFKLNGKEHVIDLSVTDWTVGDYAQPKRKVIKKKRLCVPKLTDDFIDELTYTIQPTTPPKQVASKQEAKDNA